LTIHGCAAGKPAQVDIFPKGISMSALYAMKYTGSTGMGDGCLYVGDGKITGMDFNGGRYHGAYTEQEDQIQASVKLTMVIDGLLVTGQRAPKGTELALAVTWPRNFANGEPLPIQVGGGRVRVVFEKIGEI
jgi:hypothetical protein